MTSLYLPDEYDANAIIAFAMIFNGYKQFGSFEASASAAESGDRSSLDLLLNELFFETRASRHRGDDRFIELYREIRPLIQMAAGS